MVRMILITHAFLLMVHKNLLQCHNSVVFFGLCFVDLTANRLAKGLGHGILMNDIPKSTFSELPNKGIFGDV